MSNHDIQLLILDVDGVLTDGTILFDDRGHQARRFHIQDGLGISMFQKVAGPVAILTSKKSEAVRNRAAMLGIERIEQGADDKLPGLQRLLTSTETPAQQAAYIGDDLLDLPVLRRVGYPMTVANAVAEVKQEAVYVTQTPGGQGAVREAIEHLLQRDGKWAAAIKAIGADR